MLAAPQIIYERLRGYPATKPNTEKAVDGIIYSLHNLNERLQFLDKALDHVAALCRASGLDFDDNVNQIHQPTARDIIFALPHENIALSLKCNIADSAEIIAYLLIDWQKDREQIKSDISFNIDTSISCADACHSLCAGASVYMPASFLYRLGSEHSVEARPERDPGRILSASCESSFSLKF